MTLAWILFNLFVLLMLALDLGVFHRKSHEVTIREALIWSGVWIALALLFNAGLWLVLGATPALEFLTGYVVEKSLSVDNIFVFLIIFSAFQVPKIHQHRVLIWGIIGALIMRAILIFAGISLIERFHFVIYLFAVFLAATGLKIIAGSEQRPDPERSWVYRLGRRFLSIRGTVDKGQFFLRQNGRWYATPLFLVLLMIETTDLVFAVDSIPAVLAITQDPFIVYTANVFAILGLRSLYFALQGVVDRLIYLKPALGVVLIFVGIKMGISHWLPIPAWFSLGVIGLILSVGTVASLLKTGFWASRTPGRMSQQS